MLVGEQPLHVSCVESLDIAVKELLYACYVSACHMEPPIHKGLSSSLPAQRPRPHEDACFTPRLPFFRQCSPPSVSLVGAFLAAIRRIAAILSGSLIDLHRRRRLHSLATSVR